MNDSGWPCACPSCCCCCWPGCSSYGRLEGPGWGCSMPWSTGLCSRLRRIVVDRRRRVPARAALGARQTTLGAWRRRPGPRRSSWGPRRRRSRFLNDADGGAGAAEAVWAWRASGARRLRRAGIQRGILAGCGILASVGEVEKGGGGGRLAIALCRSRSSVESRSHAEEAASHLLDLALTCARVPPLSAAQAFNPPIPCSARSGRHGHANHSTRSFLVLASDDRSTRSSRLS